MTLESYAEVYSNQFTTGNSPFQPVQCRTTKKRKYSQLSPCGHLAITDTPIKRTAAKSQEKTNYRRLIEINSCYHGLSLMRTLTRGPYGVRYKESELYVNQQKITETKDKSCHMLPLNTRSGTYKISANARKTKPSCSHIK